MNAYNQGHSDAMSGANPTGLGYHGKDYDDYMAGYHATQYGMEIGKGVGESLGALGHIGWLIFFRLPFLYPALFVFYIFAKWGIYGSDLGDFIENFSVRVVPLIISTIFILIPITIFWYYLYLYLRGLEFARYITKKPSRLLFTILGVYTIVGSSIVLILMVAAFPFTYQYFWIKLLLLMLILPNVFSLPVKFHWTSHREGNYFKKYKYFRKGFMIHMKDVKDEITLDEVQSLSIDMDEKRKARLKMVKIISYFMSVLIFLLLDVPSTMYTWHNYIAPKLWLF